MESQKCDCRHVDMGDGIVVLQECSKCSDRYRPAKAKPHGCRCVCGLVGPVTPYECQILSRHESAILERLGNDAKRNVSYEVSNYLNPILKMRTAIRGVQDTLSSM